MAATAAVIGPIARNLVVLGSGRSSPLGQYRERLGGRGADVAVGLAQLGCPVALLGVVGDDAPGERLLDRAGAAGVETGWVLRRRGAPTGLVVDLLGADGRWRCREDRPAGWLSLRDVTAARPLLTSAATVVIEPQPGGATLAAAECAHSAGRRVVLDGHPGEDPRSRVRLLAATEVLCLDRAAGSRLAGRPLDAVDVALKTADGLLRLGPALVALDLAARGTLFVWADRHLLLPPSGGGSAAFTAALAWSLTRGQGPRRAARLAVAASQIPAGRPGGRPDLSPEALAPRLAELDRHIAPAR
ncbi:PfkB family carbohydrate kinase [Amycolatopsis sp. PS_44_ISF1]|uniref:PfkB family carbohydrate kinase n=1 Tax=Amycolatopsis sp. PS_44_ISF1 TaxID=2974917 RepID=UPI0028DDBC1E|nr:PfkB family carbohydrate kinase [Amycolatopsis sp. PS_44_ISF1]MDT8912859.1 PfkB family carbohydrate kinase [Amycolatopsis sp. PS_44_ISF1]